MKFGIFYELSVPRPWTRESERTVYNNALEQVQLADELGFDQVWCIRWVVVSRRWIQICHRSAV